MKRITQILTLVLLTVGMTSCFHFPIGISGTGPVVTRNMDVAAFDAVSVETVIDVEIVQGDSLTVVAEGHENMMNFLDLQVRNGKLHVDLVHGSYTNFKMKLYITMPTLSELDAESTGDILVDGFTGLESLRLESTSTGSIESDGYFEIDGNMQVYTSSTGKIKVKAECHEIDARASSTGSISIEGICDFQDVELSGTGNYNAFDLSSDECRIESSGIGDAKVNVSDKLDVVIRSVGSVYYRGNPSIDVRDYSIGSLIRAD